MDMFRSSGSGTEFWFGLLFLTDLKYCKAYDRIVILLFLVACFLNQRPMRMTPNDDMLASSSTFP